MHEVGQEFYEIYYTSVELIYELSICEDYNYKHVWSYELIYEILKWHVSSSIPERKHNFPLFIYLKLIIYHHISVYVIDEPEIPTTINRNALIGRIIRVR